MDAFGESDEINNAVVSCKCGSQRGEGGRRWLAGSNQNLLVCLARVSDRQICAVRSPYARLLLFSLVLVLSRAGRSFKGPPSYFADDDSPERIFAVCDITVRRAVSTI